MPYRPTERTAARNAQTRRRIVIAARGLIAEGGYAEAQVAAVAGRANVATGTVYRHFPSKAELFAEVFRDASQREVDAVAVAATESGDGAAARIAAAVETERLVFRRAYRDVFAGVIEAGVEAGELPPQDPGLSAAALVGAIGEALVGPVSPTAAARDQAALVASLVDFCLRSVTGKEPAVVNA